MQSISFMACCMFAAFMLVGCDSAMNNTDNSDKTSSALLDGQIAVSSAQACSNLTRDIIYDSFDYNNAGFGTNNLFGDNTWDTCTSTPDVTRMWYRYNHDDLTYNSFTNLFITSDSNPKLRFRVESGYPGSSPVRPPIIKSGTETIQGTYVARIKFGDIPIFGPRVTMAFWTQQDQQLHDSGQTTGNYEMDFEWNNWFQSQFRNGPLMNATNHRAGSSSGGHLNELDCTYYNGSSTFKDKCGQGQFIYTDPNPSAYSDSDVSQAKSNSSSQTPSWESYIPGEIGVGRYENEWWTLMAVHKGNRVEYSMQADGYGGVSGSVWAGGSSFGQPKIIWSHVPDVIMNVEFAILPFPDSSYPVNSRLEMFVDWFYYTPSTNVSMGDVKNDIVKLDAIGPRVNTTGFNLEGTN